MNNIKHLTLAASIGISALLGVAGCGSHKEPGRIYMPDMTYSRAVETYSEQDSSVFTRLDNRRGGSQIFYNAIPPAGTIKRGELFPYSLPNDSMGYKMSAGVKNPIDSLGKLDMPETARLFNINCAICHGATGAANGPLATGGQIGGVANLTLPAYVELADGTMFHSITYGKGNMGSYASQLDRKQRWMIVKYIRTLQKPAGAAAAAATPDSAVVKK
ncbi:MAG: cytochrome c [Ferruginibacter sp.]